MPIGIFLESVYLLAGGLLALWFVVLLVRTLLSRNCVRWGGWGICAALWLVVLLMLPLFSSAREPTRRATCANHIFQIGKALLNYESVHRRFPPAYSTDKDGRPLHSWRVLLLPFLEQDELYRQIRLDEPWDSPHNRAVFDANPMPYAFGCPTDREAGKKETNYVMIVGPGTFSDGPNSVRFKQITDRADNTIAVVEIADSGIHWAEPRDLKADEMSYRINDPDQPSISSHHHGGAHAVFVDGSYQFLEDSTDPETVKALTTIAGGEDVNEFMKQWKTWPVD